jgi:hypothetical protein
VAGNRYPSQANRPGGDGARTGARTTQARIAWGDVKRPWLADRLDADPLDLTANEVALDRSASPIPGSSYPSKEDHN